MNLIKSYLNKHHWFIKNSCDYLGWDDYYKARFKGLGIPFKIAYIRFMWYSRFDILNKVEYR